MRAWTNCVRRTTTLPVRSSHVYSTCLFCHHALGTNESLEHFPVGRRLAYDAATGRLWVVCSHCERWNLSPLESRWEAIDEAERLFRATKLRVSTDNIGLAQLRDGTELVRIGAPPTLEFAAWRYGDQFGRRWRRYAVGSALTAAAPIGFGLVQAVNVGGMYFQQLRSASVLTVAAGGVGVFAAGNAIKAYRHFRSRRTRITLSDVDGQSQRTTLQQLDEATRRVHDDRNWHLRLYHIDVMQSGRPGWRAANADAEPPWPVHYAPLTLQGDAALSTLSIILPHVNRGGGTRRQIDDAVAAIGSASDLTGISENAPRRRFTRRVNLVRSDAALATLPHAVRLALEMSLHANDERRAMAGELHVLEQRWRDADAIAKIADNLFLPDS